MISITPVVPEPDPDGFKNGKERAAYVEGEYFAALREHELFLIIARSVELIPNADESVFIEQAYFGTLAGAGRLFRFAEAEQAFVIATSRHVRYLECCSPPQFGQDLSIEASAIAGVPLTRPFRHPRHGNYVRAFEVLLGASAIEARCLSLLGHADGLPRKVFAACEALGWNFFSQRYSEARAALRQRLVASLCAPSFSSSRREALLAQACELGFDRDAAPVAVDGRWWRTSDVIADLKRRIPTSVK